MTRPLPDESSAYQKILDEHIKLPADVWGIIYHRISDALSVINLSCKYYLELNEPMPIGEAKEILNYLRRIKLGIDRLTKKLPPPDLLLPEFKEDDNLHTVIIDLFTHHISNDASAINLIIYDSIDPLNPGPVSIENLKKILEYTESSKAFMDRLKGATQQESQKKILDK